MHNAPTILCLKIKMLRNVHFENPREAFGVINIKYLQYNDKDCNDNLVGLLFEIESSIPKISTICACLITSHECYITTSSRFWVNNTLFKMMSVDFKNALLCLIIPMVQPDLKIE